ncbi:MAG: low molecular weight phosphotyrosine protein phosphatase [Sphingomonadales bacterium]|nr:low molecular weight phosphotyrosine protein phosphatase [Sphingomonadales bacterium]MBD3772728.1 low molecular weight phosphotyrosine protein phosphatase [Paracoccaceae bacterium]
MSQIPSFLFVCLGNICRSPMAEGAMRQAAAAAGIELHIDSAGTAAYHVGEPPDPRAIRAAAANGADIAGLRARQAVAEDFARFTHIFALDHQNLAALERLAPAGSGAQLALLLDAVPGREGEAVVDPYYGGAEGFAATWADVSTAAARLVAMLARAPQR